MSFILVLYIYAGPFAKGDSVALEHINGFRTIDECKAAGEASRPLVSGSAKELRFVCLKG